MNNEFPSYYDAVVEEQTFQLAQEIKTVEAWRLHHAVTGAGPAGGDGFNFGYVL